MATDSIDTNIVLRCILGDVPEQRKKANEFLKTPNDTHYLSSQAILECVYVMEVALGMMRTEVVDMMSFFLVRYADHLEYDRNMTAVTLPYYLEHPKLSWVDCALAAEAETKHREPLFTFDKKLGSQAPQAKLLLD